MRRHVGAASTASLSLWEKGRMSAAPAWTQRRPNASWTVQRAIARAFIE